MERNARFELTVHSFFATMETGSGHETHLCIPLRPVMSMVLRDIPKLIDEPTRGVDVGAKIEIYNIINHLAEEGKAIVMISSEMAEIIGMCDRSLVMREGVVMGELSRDELTEENLIKLSMGVM